MQLIQLSSKKLTCINLGIVGYFIFIWLVHVYQFNAIIIGVIRELLTIPILLSQFVFLFFSLKFFWHNKPSFMFIISLLLLLGCIFFTFKSFF